MNIDAAWKLHDERALKIVHGQGSVFTPRDVTLQLADLTLGGWAEDSTPALLDPACGGGALLLGAIEWATTHQPAWLEYWRDGGLVGWDLNADAIECASAVLALAIGSSPAWVKDGLTSDGQFDVVLANPPWISFSGRHAAPIAPERKAELSAKFPAFAGWPALHTAFAEQCSRLTRQDCGRLGLLLPIQMADLAGYAAARESVTSRLTLLHVIELGEGVFENVTEPCGLFVFAGGAGASRPWLPDHDATLIARARRLKPLPPGSFGDIGVHTGNAAQLLVGEHGEGRPLRVGRDIQPFKLNAPSHALRDIALPDGKYARVASESRYRETRIVLRQTGARPIAAKHEPWALFRNSVLACFGAPGHDDDFLLGVLNSDLVGELHRAMFRDARQKAFPQLKISHLRALPFPGAEIGGLYARIANASRAVQGGDTEARDQLERLVARAYS